MDETLVYIRSVFLPALKELDMWIEGVDKIGMVPMFSRVHHIAQMAKSPIFAIPSSARDVNSKGLWKEMRSKQLTAAREQGVGYRKYFIEIAGNLKKSSGKLLRSDPAGDLEVRNICCKPEYCPSKPLDLNNLNKLEWVLVYLRAIMRKGKREALNFEEADKRLNISEMKHFQELIVELSQIKKPKSYNIDIVPSKQEVNWEPRLTDQRVKYENTYNEMVKSKNKYAEACSAYEKKILLLEGEVEREKTINDNTLKKLGMISIEVSNKESLLTEKTSEWEQKLTNFWSEIRLKDEAIKNLKKVASESDEKLALLRRSNLEKDRKIMKLKIENETRPNLKIGALTKKQRHVKKVGTSSKRRYEKLTAPKADLNQTKPVKNVTSKDVLKERSKGIKSRNELSRDMDVETATKSEVLRLQQEKLSTAEDELRNAIDLLCNSSAVVEKISKLWVEFECTRILDNDMLTEHQERTEMSRKKAICESSDLALVNVKDKDKLCNQGTVCSPGQEISCKTQKIKKVINMQASIISTKEIHSPQPNLASEEKISGLRPNFFENCTQRRGKSDGREERAIRQGTCTQFRTALTESAINYLDNPVTGMIEFAKPSNFKSSNLCDTNLRHKEKQEIHSWEIRPELLKRLAQIVMTKALDNCCTEWKLKEINGDISRKYGTRMDKSLLIKVLKMQSNFPPKSILGEIDIRSRRKMKQTDHELIQKHSPALYKKKLITSKKINSEKERSSATVIVDSKRLEIKIILPASFLRPKFDNYIFMTEQDYHGFRKNYVNHGKFSFKVASIQEAQDICTGEKAKGETNRKEKPDFLDGIASEDRNAIARLEAIRPTAQRRNDDEHFPNISFKVVNNRKSLKRRACYDFSLPVKKKFRTMI